jgi:hypothetical protein
MPVAPGLFNSNMDHAGHPPFVNYHNLNTTVMRSNTTYHFTIPFLLNKRCSLRGNNFNLFQRSFFLLFYMLIMGLAGFAQTTTTFPSASSCTSKDLELVSARLTGGDVCNSCTPGATLTRNLTLAINNKTGSSRTAFAFWGTLEITHADGTVERTPISRCNGPIPSTGPLPAYYDGLNFGTVTYTCGDALKITNLFLAWTDASPKSTCATINSATINPKCGTLPEIQINAGVNGSAVAGNLTCFGASNGTIDLTPFGGTAPYTFSWTASNGGNVPSLQATNEDLTGLTKGTYTCVIKDKNNCTFSKVVTLTGPLAGLALGASSKTDVTCFGGSNGTVSAGTVSNSVGTISYSWKNATNDIVATTPNKSGLPAGIYTLTVSDDCSSQNNSVTIGGPSAALALGTCSKTDVSCFGGSDGSVTAGTVTNAVGTVNYSWKNAGGTVVATSATKSGLAAGTYTLTVSDNCSSQNCTVTIGGPSAALALGTCSKTDVSCFGGSDGSVTAGTVSNAVGTVNYSWKNAGGTVVATSATKSGLAAGAYTLTVSDNCSSQNCTVTIGGPSAALALGTCSKTDVSCFGGSDGSVTAGTVTNAVGTVNYSWKNASNAEVSTSATKSGLPAGAYTLTVSDNCFTRTCSVTIGGPSAALALGTCSKTDVSCAGSDGSVTAGTVTNSIGTVHYSWKNSSNTEIATTATKSGLNAGTYTLTVSDNCSSQTCSVTVNAPPTIPTPSASVTQQPDCFIQNGTVTVSSPEGSTTYTLTQSNVVKYTAVSGVFNNVIPGTYTLVATVGICSKTGNNVTVNTQPATPGTPSVCVVQPSLCGPATGKVNFTSLGTGFQYSIDNGAHWQDCNVFLTVAAGGVSGLKVKSPAGCISPAANCNTICASDPVACSVTGRIAAKSTNTATTDAAPLQVKAYPNPFNEKINFVVTSPLSGKGSLDVYNALGQKIKTVYQGNINKGTQNFELHLSQRQVSNLVYVLRVGGQQVSGKILQINQ